MEQIMGESITQRRLQGAQLGHALRAEDISDGAPPALHEPIVRKKEQVLVRRLNNVLHRHRRVWSAAVLVSTFGEELTGVARIADDHEVLGSHLEADDVAILL